MNIKMLVDMQCTSPELWPDLMFLNQTRDEDVTTHTTSCPFALYLSLNMILSVHLSIITNAITSSIRKCIPNLDMAVSPSELSSTPQWC